MKLCVRPVASRISLNIEFRFFRFRSRASRVVTTNIHRKLNCVWSGTYTLYWNCAEPEYAMVGSDAAVTYQQPSSVPFGSAIPIPSEFMSLWLCCIMNVCVTWIRCRTTLPGRYTGLEMFVRLSNGNRNAMRRILCPIFTVHISYAPWSNASIAPVGGKL